MTDQAVPAQQAYLEQALGAQAAYKLHFHPVWSVKARQRLLIGAVAEALRGELARVAETLQATILAMHVEPERVHLLLSLRPDRAVAAIIGRMKGASAYTLRRSFPQVRAAHEQSLWNDGYFARTIGAINVAQATAYLDRQRERHGG